MALVTAPKGIGLDGIIAATQTGKTALDELIDDHATLVTWLAEVDGDLDKINDYLHRLGEFDGVIHSTASFATATAVTIAGSGQVTYRIGGRIYSAAVDTTITLTDDGNVTQAKFRAWRILMLRDGTTVTLSAGTAINADNAEQALFSLAQNALTANSVEIGYITATDSNSVIDIGTDNTDASGSTYVFYKVSAPRFQTGLTAALGASVTADAATNTVDLGTTDAHISAGTLAGPWSRNLTQIAASANTAMSVADTIDTVKFGGWLICTDLAGTGYIMLSADGDMNATGVTAQAYANDAAVITALDLVQARLPCLFCPVGTIQVNNAAGGSFTAASTNWDATSTTTTFEDYTSGEFDRTKTTAVPDGSVASRQLGMPTLPATVTGALVATLTASKSDTIL